MVAPTGITSTGWPAVRKTCVEKMGIAFDDWQEGAGRLILAKRQDGNLAAMIDGVGLSLPRQVGKTYLIGSMIFALCVNTPNLLVIWSAHHARTHGETFLAMQAFAERSRVRPFVKQVFTGSGDEEIRFHNGSRVLFGARERGFGRGIPGVDVLVMDEAQILSDKALSNMLATMNTSSFGLSLFIGTPPKPEDMSEAFKRMRDDALKGRLTDGAWIEFGAARGADLNDRKQWAKANPSYPLRTPEQSILRLQRKLTPEDFAREGMGIWDEEQGEGLLPNWPACKTDDAPPEPLALGFAVSIDREWASIAAAGRGVKMHLGAVHRSQGTAAAVSEVVRISTSRGLPVAIDKGGPAADLIDDLEAAGVQVVATTTAQYLDACAGLYDAVSEGDVQHADHPELNAAVRNATKRKVGERWAIARKGGDVSMLEAAALARWAAEQGPSIYEGRGLVTL